jgi:tetratricopeptide (TPR) repeat protein
MEDRIACAHCHSSIYPPPVDRDYACPQCGRRLPRRAAAGASVSTWAERLARGSLAVGCLATLVAVGWHLVLTPRARTAAPGSVGLTVVRQPFQPEEEERYRRRIRQLETDLDRDPREYGVLMRLAALHLRLGVRQRDMAQREIELQSARGLYERSMEEGIALSRRDFEFAAFQLERLAGRYPLEEGLADPVPSSDPLATASPGTLDVEQMLRMRLDYTRFSLARRPDNARLFCRLGWVYFRLAQTIRRRTGPATSGWYYDPADGNPERLLTEAEKALRRAAAVSRTREFRVEAYEGLAVLYQDQDRWEDALSVLERIVALQPNNWPANTRVAGILRRLGREKDYAQALRRADAWRTPEWL